MPIFNFLKTDNRSQTRHLTQVGTGVSISVVVDKSVVSIGWVSVSGVSSISIWAGKELSFSFWLGLSLALSDVVASSVDTISVWVAGGISVGLGGKVGSCGLLNGKGWCWGESSISISGQADGCVGVGEVGISIEVLSISLWSSLSLTLSNKVSSVVSVTEGGNSSLGSKVLGFGSLNGESVSGDKGAIGISGQTKSGVCITIVWASNEVLCISFRLCYCNSSKNENCNLENKLEVIF